MIGTIAFGLFGLAVLISVAYALSSNKKSIDRLANSRWASACK